MSTLKKKWKFKEIAFIAVEALYLLRVANQYHRSSDEPQSIQVWEVILRSNICVWTHLVRLETFGI